MGAVMIGASVLNQRPWWTYPNLLAVAWYGPRALWTGPGWATLSGSAFQLSIAGTAGAMFGLLFGNLAGAPRVALLGAFWGIVLFFVSERAFDAAAPLVTAHVPRGASMLSHVVYGMFLAGARRRHPAPFNLDQRRSLE